MSEEKKSFHEALGDLLMEYSNVPLENVIEIMEMHLEALRDDAIMMARLKEE